MTIQDIKSKYNDLLKSMKLCKDNEFKESVLILMYSTIDSLSWLNSAECDITNRIVKDDFINFSNQYIISKLFVDITAEELYDARCAVVHTISARAKNNIKNNTRFICYSNNQQAADESNIFFNKLQQNVICIDIIDLLAILVDAIEEFFDEVNEDEKKKEKIIKKAEEYYLIY